MRSLLAIIFLLGACCLPQLAIADEATAIADADRLYAQRANSDKASEAVEFLQQAVQDHPDSYALHWRLARAAWWIGDGTENETTDKEMGQIGWDAGARAIELNSSGLEGHYWTTLAMGEYSKGISILKAIGQGLDKKFSSHLDTVLAADEGYDNGGALRAKGMYWHELPRIMRDRAKALEKLERSNELIPNHPRTLYYLAVVNHAEGNEEAARACIEASIAAAPRWPDAPERARVLGWARTLDGQIP